MLPRCLAFLLLFALVRPAFADEADEKAIRKAVTFYASFDDEVKGDFGGGQLADDAREATGRQRGGAFFFDLGFGDAADADIEVGGRQVQSGSISLQEHIREDRQGRASAHDVLHDLQTFEELLFADAKFHRERRCD